MEAKAREEKGFFGKLKDAAEDQEHQIQILGTFVRLGVVIWSGFIITLNYVELPMIKKSGKPFVKVLDEERLRPTDITLQIPSTDKFRGDFNWKPKKTMDNIWDDLLKYWREII